MKKWENYMKTVLEVSLIILAVILSASLFAGEQPFDPLSEQVTRLKERLKLDDTQTAKVREILETDRGQTAKDRETFKGNALSLIQVATDRRKTTNMHIESLLNPDQKERFKEIVKMTRFDRDLFELIEGLCLNDEQAFTVEGILIDYYNAVKGMIPEEMQPGVGDERSGRFGRMIGSGRLRAAMKAQEKKKNKAVKKILTKEQKELFKQIREDRKKKRKEWMKKSEDTQRK